MLDSRRRVHFLTLAAWLFLCAAALSSAAHAGAATASKLGKRVDLGSDGSGWIAADNFRCFSGSEFALLNPGCFVTSNPSQPGDCTSSASHFLVQYLFVDPPVPYRVQGFGFLSNDRNTVFPAAGVLVLPAASPRFPTAAELTQLQVHDLQAAEDTTRVFVDLSAHDLVLQPGTRVALLLILQFPAGGQLVAPTQGPGVAAERSAPDERCDYFTIDGGRSGTWFEPRYDPGDPQSVPLEWGFVATLQPLEVGISSLSWGQVKRLYRDP